MGSRCDFYAGRGLGAQYLGSIGHDSSDDQMSVRFAGVVNRDSFDSCLAAVFKDYGEIKASNGWPWPWRSSDGTGTVVAFDDDKVWINHPSGFWAPLDDYESPTAEQWVFNDMVAAEEATPEGRLRLVLRHNGVLFCGPDKNPMVEALVSLARLLTKVWIHMYQHEGAYWILPSFWDNDKFALMRFSIALKADGEEFGEMLSKQRAEHGDEAWNLLQWVLDTGIRFTTERVELPLTPEQPVYFRQVSCAEAIAQHQQPFVFLRFTDSEVLREGLRLLDVVLDEIPIVFVTEVARAIRDMGVLPVPIDQADEWINAPKDEFNGETLVAISATAAGRERVLKFAAQMVFGTAKVNAEAIPV